MHDDIISPSITTLEFVKHSYSHVCWFTEHKWWYITFNNEELSHYLEEVVSSEAWTCDSPRYETIADRDPPPTADDQEIHHSVPKATPKSLGQSNYKDNINIILSLNAFLLWQLFHQSHASNGPKIIIYQFCMTIMLLEKFITKHLIL